MTTANLLAVCPQQSAIPPTNNRTATNGERRPDPASTPDRAGASIATEDAWSKRFNTFLSEKPATPAATGPALRPDLAETFRHGGWAPVRRRVADAMAALSSELSPRRIAAFAGCGCDACVEYRFIGHHQTKEYRIKSTKCHDRFCTPCSNERARIYRTVLLNHMYKKENMKLITLTLRQSDAHLKDVLDRITAAFKRLRNTPLWKKAVSGGAAIIEVKRGDDGTSWNCHYHIVCESKFIVQKQLSDAWLKITGDSYIVDIRAVGAKSGAIQYITKYVTKAGDPTITSSPKHLQEAIIAFQARRLVTTFASWRGLVLSEDPDAEQESPSRATDWMGCGLLSTILHDALNGHAESLAIVRKLAPHKFRTPDRPPSAPPGL